MTEIVEQAEEFVEFEIPRVVSITRENGSDVWIARDGDRQHPDPDPAFALSRFVPPSKAQSMVGAWIAFKEIPTSESETS